MPLAFFLLLLLSTAALGAGQLAGLVVDPAGKPVAGATVRLFPAAAVDPPAQLGFDARGAPLTPPAASLQTDKKGRFLLPLPAAEARPLLMVSARGHSPFLLRVEPPPAPPPPPRKGKARPKPPAPTRIQLSAGATLDVMTRCGEDPCPAEVEVWATVGTDARMTRAPEQADKVTFEDLTAGDLELTASSLRGTPRELYGRALVSLREGDAQTVALVLEPLDPCEISGQVTDPRGQPLRADVRADCGGLRRSTTADAGGRFTVTGLPRERCTVAAEVAGEADPDPPRKVFAQLQCPAKDVSLVVR